MIGVLQACVMVLLTLSSVLMDPQYGTSRKRKRKFSKMYVRPLHSFDQRLQGARPCISPGSSGSVVTNSVSVETL